MITYPLTQRTDLQYPSLLLEGPGSGHCKQSSKACGWVEVPVSAEPELTLTWAAASPALAEVLVWTPIMLGLSQEADAVWTSPPMQPSGAPFPRVHPEIPRLAAPGSSFGMGALGLPAALTGSCPSAPNPTGLPGPTWGRDCSQTPPPQTRIPPVKGNNLCPSRHKV